MGIMGIKWEFVAIEGNLVERNNTIKTDLFTSWTIKQNKNINVKLNITQKWTLCSPQAQKSGFSQDYAKILFYTTIFKFPNKNLQFSKFPVYSR